VRSPRTLPAAALAILLTGCHSVAVVWEGRTPDGRSVARVVEDEEGQRIEIGGAPSKPWDAIAPETITFSPEGAVAFAARAPEGWTVVADGRAVLPTSRAIRDVSWSREQGALTAVLDTARGTEVVVVRGARSDRPVLTRGPALDGIAAESLVTTRDGHVAYVGMDRDGVHVVLGVRPGRAWDAIARLHLSEDGRASYLARGSGHAWVVRHALTTGPFEDVADLVVSPDGERVAALVLDAQGWRVDDGATTSEPFDAVGDLRVSRDHVAFRAVLGGEERVVVDGETAAQRGPIAPGTLTLLHDGHVAFVARDGRSHLVIAKGEIVGAFTWAGDLIATRGGLAFAAEERGRLVIVADGRRRDVPGLVRGTLRASPDGARWAALSRPEGALRLVRSHGPDLAIDVAVVTEELVRRRGADAREVLEDLVVAALSRPQPRAR